MWFMLVFVFLFSFGCAEGAEVYGSNYRAKRGDYEYGLTYDDQDIFEEDISRPCALNDWQCMRQFLASNSKCRPAYGPVPDPLNLPVDKFYIPNVNLTITHTNLEIRGFRSAKITEFYFNKARGNVVIAINVSKLNQTSPRSFFTYQRTAKEPIIHSDFTTVTYDSATFTAVIPKAPNLQLDRAEIHADIHDSRPVYAIGPRAGNSTDPDVVAAYSTFIVNIPTIIQEAFAFQSSLLTTIYIQTYLCDFGVRSYGNYLDFLGSKGYTQVSGVYENDNYKLYEQGNNGFNKEIVGPPNYVPKYL